uniref:NADH-ubiquinone oxidoreductase chain 2 n=1 Tax=Synapha fasciata TaxID=2339123 RepID=A0A7L7S0J6_9DIPT|nr:NADH dehydrogenase subunit 2 [Synapha fasciata]
MIKNSSKLIFFFTMILGTFITISSNSWFGVWMGLEINLLSFIPLMIDTNNLLSTEASLKYFLVQTFASLILLFSMMMFILFNNFIYSMSINNYLYSSLIFLALIIKSGMAPFHFWFPNVMEGLSWYMNLMLMTWQKIAPLIIISYLMMSKIYFLFIIISAITGAMGGLNQTSLRKIMAFSSINHLSWMMVAMMFNEFMWLFYFFIYSLISFSIVFLFNSFKIFYINQLFNSMFNSKIFKFIILITFLSLAGLPPFLGFLPKWLVIQSLMTTNHMFLIMILIMMSLITMFFYLRICYSSFMINYLEIKWFMFFNFKIFYLINMLNIIFISILGLFI